MRFIDLTAQHHKLHEDINQRLAKVFAHSEFIMGPEVFELEQQLAEYVGVEHCISVASGTDALQIAMMALGVGPGDEVITSSFSFIATAETILLLGAKPVFVDIDPVSYNLDVAQVEAKITDKTKLILPVDLYGQCADYDAINDIARRHGLPVVEDAAQSFGSTYRGRLACSLSDIACTSFFPSKPLGCYGDGGACFTNNEELAQHIKEIRNHGQSRRYHHTRLGMNSRLDTIQAAILQSKLQLFKDEEVEQRQQVAEHYSRMLSSFIEPPKVLPGNTSVFAQYTVRVKNREFIRRYMQDQSIPTAVHYPTPLHKQPVFESVNGSYELPESEAASHEVMSLPFHPYLSEKELSHIVRVLRDALKCAATEAEGAVTA